VVSATFSGEIPLLECSPHAGDFFDLAVVMSIFQALLNRGWREIQVSGERHFKKNFMHLILQKTRAGHYCMMHIDRFVYGRLHQHSIHKSEELADEFKQAIAEYKRLRN
jgi:hypothetical protein